MFLRFWSPLVFALFIRNAKSTNEIDQNTQYSWDEIQSNLKREARVLRDHNLYMAPLPNFKELYDRGLLQSEK